MYAFLEIIAAALVYAAVEALIGQKSWHIWGGCLALAIVFFVAGINWGRIKSTIGKRLSLCVSLALFAAILVVGILWPQFWLRLGVLLAIYVSVYGILYIRSLRKDIEAYVLPRRITNDQAEGLREYLSHHEPHPVTVKVNPRDAEAREYASQILNALKRTEWEVEFSTSDAVPHTLNEGLCIGVVGANAGPRDPKHNPQQLLQQAFRAARIIANGSSSASAGNYALFVLVGPRPLRLSASEPLLRRLGRWLAARGARTAGS